MQTRPHEIVAVIDQVSKNFVGKKALIDISMDIKRGEILSILGPNGAGKTTLTNMMLGRLSLSAGNMSLFGLQPGNIELKRQCGAMLQVASLPDMSTVKKHIQLFRSYYSNPMNYEQVINFSGLQEIENDYSKNLSSGEKQRLLFALSICGNTKLLFLDEPTVGLDISARKSLWRAIGELENISRDALKQIREVVTDYRTSNLNTELAHAKYVLESNEISFEYQFDDIEISNIINKELAIILKELVTNILKHAGASKVRAEITSEESRIVLRVSDNGGGFSQEITKGFGLKGINERVDKLSGRVKIETEINSDSGSEFTILVPMAKH